MGAAIEIFNDCFMLYFRIKVWIKFFLLVLFSITSKAAWTCPPQVPADGKLELQNYPSSTCCSWRMTVEWGYYIEVEFHPRNAPSDGDRNNIRDEISIYSEEVCIYCPPLPAQRSFSCAVHGGVDIGFTLPKDVKIYIYIHEQKNGNPWLISY